MATAVLVGTVGIALAWPLPSLARSDIFWALKSATVWYGGLGALTGAMLEGLVRGRRVLIVAVISCVASMGIMSRIVYLRYPQVLDASVSQRLAMLAVAATTGIVLVFPFGTRIWGLTQAMSSDCRVCGLRLAILKRYPSFVVRPEAVCLTCFETASLEDIRAAHARFALDIRITEREAVLDILSHRVSEISERFPARDDAFERRRPIAAVLFDDFCNYVDITMLKALEKTTDRRQLIDRFLRWTTRDGYVKVVSGMSPQPIHDLIVSEWRRKVG